MEIAVKAYTVDVHPNKSAVFDWVRDNWHDLAESDIDDIVGSLKALAVHTNGTIGYSISAVPDRSEFIQFTDFDSNLLADLDPDECPLTGTWSDFCVIKGAQSGELQSEVLAVCHDCGEFRYSDEGIEEFLAINKHLFLEDGRLL